MGVLDPLLLVVAAMGVSMTGVMLREKPTFPDASASVYPLFTFFLPMSMFMMMMNSTYGGVPGVALITMAFAIAYGGGRRGVFRRSCVRQAQALPERQPEKDGRRRNFRLDWRNGGRIDLQSGLCFRVPYADARHSGNDCAGVDWLGSRRNRRLVRVAAQAAQRY